MINSSVPTTSAPKPGRRPRRPRRVRRWATAIVGAITVSLSITGAPSLAHPTPPRSDRPSVDGAVLTSGRDVSSVSSSVEKAANAMPVSGSVRRPVAGGRGTALLATARRAPSGLTSAGQVPVDIGAATASAPLRRHAGLRASGSTSPTLQAVEVTTASPVSTDRIGAVAAFSLAPAVKTALPGSRRALDQLHDNVVTLRLRYADLLGDGSADVGRRLRLISYPLCVQDPSPAPRCLQGEPLESVSDARRQTISAAVPLASARFVAAAAGPSGSGGDFGATPLAAAGQWSAGGNSGDFSWSYPFEMPPVAGDLVPDLSMSYSSAATDGHATSTNNQPSWVGEGWELGLGSIDRQYKPCQDDMGGDANNSRKTGDLCWDGQNATLAFGSHSGELVQDGTSTRWRLRDDDGTRIEQLRAPWDNGDDDREYWRVTTPNGVQYNFGLGRPHSDGPQTNSAWTVPVAGNNAGEPCHGGSFASSFCDQAWRWNLDSIVDTAGNSLTALYQKESNHYGQNSNDKAARYDRGGHLLRIEYGTRTAAEGKSDAPARVVFSTAERCIPTTTEKCTTLAKANNLAWPDVPQDQLCDSTSSCSNRESPSFFTRKRLTRITSQILSKGSYAEVQRWDLAQSFPKPGDGSSAALWLKSIVRSAAGGANPMPATVFAGTQMESRVDGVEDTLGRSADPFIKYRLTGISSETGSDTLIAYSAQDCTPTSLPVAERNGRRCFPVWFTPPGGVKPGRHWFHKYVVTKITQHDLTNASPLSVVHTYSYLGSPAWTYDDNPITRKKYRTWGRWAGYAKVREVTGNPTSARSLRTETLYHRGLDGDRDKPSGGTKTVRITDSEGASVTDARRLSGMPREQVVFNGPTGAEVSATVTDQSVLSTSATNEDGRKAERAGVTRVRTRTTLAAGGFRRTQIATRYDAAGYPIEVDDRGDVAVTTDDVCRRTSYVRNEGAWVMTTPEAVQARASSCASWPAAPTVEQVIADTRFHYDSLPYGRVRDGRLTRQEEVAGVDGGALSYRTSAEMSYDGLGRTTSTADALGRVTRTAYLPIGAGLPVSMTVTSPDPDAAGPLSSHVTTTTVDPRWGKPVALVAPGGERTEATFDGFGRLAATWQPGRTRNQTPTSKHTYTVSKSSVSSIKTETLNWDEKYMSSVELFDGLGRSKQTQSQQIGTTITPIGEVKEIVGRQLFDTVYDDRGLAVAARGPAFAAGAPSGTLYGIADSAYPRMTTSTFDGVGRLVTSTQLALGKPKWSTTTVYGGDRSTTVPPSGGTVTTTISDARGRTTGLRQYRGSNASSAYLESTYRYNAKDQLTGFSDPAGNRWGYDYDVEGREVRSSDPDSGVTTKTYDAVGQLVTVTDARQKTLAYTYDALGRKTSMRDSDPALGTVRASWGYDAVKKGYQDSATRFVAGQPITDRVTTRDSAGRPLTTELVVPQIPGWVEAPLAKTYPTTLDYRPDGSFWSSTTPDMGNLASENLHLYYDAINRPVAIGGNGSYVSQAIYSGLGPLIQWGGGPLGRYSTWATYEFDQGTGRLAKLNLDRSEYADSEYEIRYGYSNAGTITKISTARPRTTAATDTQCFGYDFLQRLTAAWTPRTADCAQRTGPLGGPAPYSRSWTYDNASNRTSESDQSTTVPVVTTWQRPAVGQPQAHAPIASSTVGPRGREGSTTIAYDAAGNTVERTSSTGAVLGGVGQRQSLSYNEEGRLSRAVQGSSTIDYLDDADGDKLLRRDGTSTTLYVGNTELTLDRKTDVVKGTRYISFAGMTVAVDTGSGPDQTDSATLWSDLNNTASWQVNNGNGKITERLSMPFGETRGKASGLFGTRGFVDGTQDRDANLVRIGARDYDPSSGMFLTPDPLVDLNDPTQWNPYGYGNGNPLTRPDPTGLMPPPFVSPGTGSAANWGALGGAASSASPKPLIPKSHSATPYSGPAQTSWSFADGRVTADVQSGLVRVDGYSLPSRSHRGSTYDLFRIAERSLNTIMSMSGHPNPTFASIQWRIAQEYCKAYGLCSRPDAFHQELKFKICSESPCSPDAHLSPLGRAARNSPEPLGELPAAVSRAGNGAAADCANSFSPDTLVLLANGAKVPIATVKVGDIVLAGNPTDNILGSKQMVVSVIRRVAPHRWISLTLEDGSAVRATSDHRLWEGSAKAFVAADTVRIGDRLLRSTGLDVRVHRRNEAVDTSSLAINLQTTGTHTFYASDSSILVHNCGSKLTNSQITQMANRLGFRRTNYTSKGEIVFSLKGKAYITQDIDGHNGGLFKMARTVRGLDSKDTRMGTYNYNLERVGP